MAKKTEQMRLDRAEYARDIEAFLQTMLSIHRELAPIQAIPARMNTPAAQDLLRRFRTSCEAVRDMLRDVARVYPEESFKVGFASTSSMGLMLQFASTNGVGRIDIEVVCACGTVVSFNGEKAKQIKIAEVMRQYKILDEGQAPGKHAAMRELEKQVCAWHSGLTTDANGCVRLAMQSRNATWKTLAELYDKLNLHNDGCQIFSADGVMLGADNVVAATARTPVVVEKKRLPVRYRGMKIPAWARC